MNSKILFLIFISFISCNVAPKKINYGKDHCTFCEMIVIDKTHACQYVTKKGKSFIFDSIECMVQKIDQNNLEQSLQFILVTNYLIPEQFINAKEATYLISKEIKSPMGANLSAFSSTEKALEIQQKSGGELFTWVQLKNKFKKRQ